MENQTLRRNPDSIKRWNAIVHKAGKRLAAYRLPNGEKVLLENIFPLEESASNELLSTGVCPFLGQEAWVSAEGVFGPCCAPNEDRRTLGNFGTLYKKSMDEIWSSDEYQYLQKNYLNYEVCKRCNMRKPVGDYSVA